MNQRLATFAEGIGWLNNMQEPAETWRKTLSMLSRFDTAANAFHLSIFCDRGGSEINSPTGHLLCQRCHKWSHRVKPVNSFNRLLNSKPFCKRGDPVWQ